MEPQSAGKASNSRGPKSSVKSAVTQNQVISCGRCLAYMEDTELVVKGLLDFVCTSLPLMEETNLHMEQGEMHS